MREPVRRGWRLQQLPPAAETCAQTWTKGDTQWPTTSTAHRNDAQDFHTLAATCVQDVCGVFPTAVSQGVCNLESALWGCTEPAPFSSPSSTPPCVLAHFHLPWWVYNLSGPTADQVSGCHCGTGADVFQGESAPPTTKQLKWDKLT